MAADSNFILNLSVLYRNTQKYYDRMLARYDIGSGQLIFLMLINENEGTTMQEVTKLSEVDKGTTTKSINRLIEQGYVQSRVDEHDHRIKRLYTTVKASEIMNSIYEYRNRCRAALAVGVDFTSFEKTLSAVTENSRHGFIHEEMSYSGLRIGGLMKTSLLDYPGKVACTVFMSGCNLKCPFCHNRDLVYIPENYDFYEPEDILQYLNKRKNILEGVCISGGEPLGQPDLKPFLRSIKEIGYAVKLDTNGTRPDVLRELIDEGLVDMAAMDVKNCRNRYAETAGIKESAFDLKGIEESISILRAGRIPYEFRTTVVKELHTLENLLEIAEWIGNESPYYLQQFHDSGALLQEGLHGYTADEMEEIRDRIAAVKEHVYLRGVKEG